MNTVLENVKFTVGDQFMFSEEGLRSIRTFAKENPNIKISGTFEVLAVKTVDAEDDHTELRDPTLGATSIKNITTGEVFTIEESNPDYWAFFTECTPHFFTLRTGV